MNNRRPKLDWVWRCLQFSVLALPLFPALGEVGLAVVLVWVWRSRYRQIIRFPLNWGLAVLSIWLIVCSLFAYRPLESWLGLANFLPFFALFAALNVLIKRSHQLRQLARLLVIPSPAIVILGLGQLYLGWQTPSWWQTIFGWGLVAVGEPAGRMSSVFIYANFLAVYLTTAFTLCLGLWLETWQRWRSKRTSRSGWILFALTAILLINSVGLVLTSSRNAWGIAFFSAIAFAMYAGWRWLVGSIAAIVTVICWAAFVPNWGGIWWRKIVPVFIWARLSDRMYPDRPVETLRLTQWRFCWNLIKERPVIGWGLRNFTPLYEAKMNVWFGHPHSLPLMLATETGIVGTLLLLSIVGWVMAKAIWLLKEPKKTIVSGEHSILFTYMVAFSGIILFNLFDVTIFDLRVNTIGWILFSAISGVVFKSERSSDRSVR
ncbi:O-antigen ligase [Myxosarcina sp. GI1]|uniref:O-antigen ligase family protein n=1 Tax=Myxosarcina sp. GI1 TaxID=1541065 RepID=UPI00056442B0|nr:O-antigen ligase family protein [Myxosarcina sp. GI1]